MLIDTAHTYTHKLHTYNNIRKEGMEKMGQWRNSWVNVQSQWNPVKKITKIQKIKGV